MVLWVSCRATASINCCKNKVTWSISQVSREKTRFWRYTYKTHFSGSFLGTIKLLDRTNTWSVKVQRYSPSRRPHGFLALTGTIPVEWKNAHWLWMGEWSLKSISQSGGLVNSTVKPTLRFKLQWTSVLGHGSHFSRLTKFSWLFSIVFHFFQYF